MGTFQNLPNFLVEYNSDRKNIKKQIPGPRIKKTTRLANGTEMYIELEWNQKDKTKEVSEVEENLFDIDADKLCEDELKSSCNTRKVKDKRDRRHTAGILISTKPCGIIPHVDELFGGESILQVHGSKFLGTVTINITVSFNCLFNSLLHIMQCIFLIPVKSLCAALVLPNLTLYNCIIYIGKFHSLNKVLLILWSNLWHFWGRTKGYFERVGTFVETF